jgi:hypothetical protein
MVATITDIKAYITIKEFHSEDEKQIILFIRELLQYLEHRFFGACALVI